MTEPGSELSFERATYENSDAAAPAGPACGLCKKPLAPHYWQWQQRVVCTSCRDQLERTLAKSRSGASFAKALLLGGLTALGCGIAYAVFVAVTKYQIAFLTIGIAFLVAKVIRKASSGVGGLRFQVLAVVLTYCAGSMGYIPAIFGAVASHAKSDAAHTHAAPHAAPASAAPADGSREGDAVTPSEEDDRPPTAFDVIKLFFVLSGYVLAMPFLTVTSSPFGLLIIGFGLWEAWKRSRGVPLVLDGPYDVAPQTTGPPAAE